MIQGDQYIEVGNSRYKICGAEMQFIEIELQPGARVVSEAGSMMYKDSSIAMEASLSDGSSNQGFFSKILSAGQRAITGAGAFLTHFTNSGPDRARVAFAAPYPGNVIPIHLAQVGGALICQKDCYLCSIQNVSINLYLQQRIMTGLFGGDGFIMQKLSGDGVAFLHAGGTIVERRLSAGEIVHVNPGSVVAFEPSIQFEIQSVKNIKTALFGGEGMFFAQLMGPGNVWMQSLPFSRLAGRMLAAAPQTESSRGDIASAAVGGTLLGTLGSIFGQGTDDGDSE
jgi:uncharacterized protein (TIGR00266 family)